ncbi:DUF3291 domain-containing protein [Chitinivorax sp. B]|uniref:DUF3291 domain-containing protein n=1 Tax=Chitinivorax sp. B TaxID=2502235 RepID=UPI0010F5EAEA|nr:DUF3291 domain-containing protein [Chitinivorax sp. B]
MSPHFHLAQVNIAKTKAPMNDPSMQGYVEQITHLNHLADQSPGFIWRLQSDEGDATAIRLFDDPLIMINLSVWTSLDALTKYVYQGDHLQAVKQRKQWFEPQTSPRLALWWLPAGELPTPGQAKDKLMQLATQGATQTAFTFAHPFQPPASC